jgi:hypothetical protein
VARNEALVRSRHAVVDLIVATVGGANTSARRHTFTREPAG